MSYDTAWWIYMSPWESLTDAIVFRHRLTLKNNGAHSTELCNVVCMQCILFHILHFTHWHLFSKSFFGPPCGQRVRLAGVLEWSPGPWLWLPEEPVSSVLLRALTVPSVWPCVQRQWLGEEACPGARRVSPQETLLKAYALLRIWEGHFQITGQHTILIFIYCSDHCQITYFQNLPPPRQKKTR